MRPRDFLAVLENPDLPRCEVQGEGADLLRSLLVHLFFADLDLDKREIALLQRVLPDIDARVYVKAVAGRRLDLDRLAELFPSAADRGDIVKLAEHAVWGDHRIETREVSLVVRLRDKLGMPRE